MLRIGWAMRDMTPTRPALLQGQMHTRIARTARDPLTVTAMAIEGGMPRDVAIVISGDLPFISDGLHVGLRKRLARTLPDVPGEKVFMTGTHTHTSLVFEGTFYPHPGGDVMTAAECETLIVERAAEAAEEAWKTRTSRAVARAFGHAVVGHNRHAVYADGHAQMYGATNRDDFVHFGGYEDHSLDMLFTWDPNGTLAGVALAIPCPSQVDEGIEEFSADYWHEVRQELRARFGRTLSVLALCSAAGDQSPHFLVYGPQEEEMRKRRGVTERQEIAQRVGDAVARALACTKPPADGPIPFAHRVQQLHLSPRRVTKEERDWAQAEYDRCAAQGPTDSWWPERLKLVVDCYDKGKKEMRAPEPSSVEMHSLRLGDLAMVTNPFELFLDYSMRIKARSPAAQTMVIQLAAVRGWYLPTERAVRGGGYGAMPAVSGGGPDTGRELVDASLQAIRTLFA